MNLSIKSAFATCAVLVASVISSGVAHAGFIGQTLEIGHLYPNITTAFTPYGLPANFLVGSGIEIPNYADVIAIDVGDANISITLAAGVAVDPGDGSGNSFDGFGFSDVFGAIGPILGVSINPATDLAGFSAARLGFDADNIFVNMEGLFTGATSRTVSIDVQFAPPTPTPAPAGLLLIGLLGLSRTFRGSARRG